MKTSGLPFEKCTLFLCGKYIFDQNKVQKKQEVIRFLENKGLYIDEEKIDILLEAHVFALKDGKK